MRYYWYLGNTHPLTSGTTVLTHRHFPDFPIFFVAKCQSRATSPEAQPCGRSSARGPEVFRVAIVDGGLQPKLQAVTGGHHQHRSENGVHSLHFDREIFNEASHLRVPHFQTACGDRSASGRTKHERNWDEYN